MSKVNAEAGHKYYWDNDLVISKNYNIHEKCDMPYAGFFIVV